MTLPHTVALICTINPNIPLFFTQVLYYIPNKIDKEKAKFVNMNLCLVDPLLLLRLPYYSNTLFIATKLLALYCINLKF